ncbi:hypothetical protein [Kitasatospora sp. NPDC101183]|uniref:hypothetical protein n=1 Tax=Kitasatospora sp. NPDC101183 TaxID=3364100 RepID=UPI0038289EFF
MSADPFARLHRAASELAVVSDDLVEAVVDLGRLPPAVASSVLESLGTLHGALRMAGPGIQALLAPVDAVVLPKARTAVLADLDRERGSGPTQPEQHDTATRQRPRSQPHNA